MNPLSIIQWAWNALPWYVQAGAIGYIAFTSIGGTLSIYNFTKSFAGKWSIPAMASLVIPLGLWVWSWMQKPAPDTHEHAGNEDPPLRKAPKSVKKRRTIQDMFSGLGK
jgi:hypothetical protein